MLRNEKFALILANLTNTLGLKTGNRRLGRHRHACCHPHVEPPCGHVS